MDINQLIKSRRSIRQFQKKEIPKEILKDCVDAGRLAPSAMNRQPLEYIVVDNKNVREKVFETLKWGGELSQQQIKEHQPQAYIIVLANIKINPNCDFDVGLATENVILSAWSKGVASCPLAAVDRSKIRDICQVPDNFKITLVIGLGYPTGKSVAEDSNETTKYWRNKGSVLHVPKRKLKDIVHFNRF